MPTVSKLCLTLLSLLIVTSAQLPLRMIETYNLVNHLVCCIPHTADGKDYRYCKNIHDTVGESIDILLSLALVSSSSGPSSA
jgi:hypothetical protein